MKLYTYPVAPNTMRVQVVTAEKGLVLETVEVPFGDREGFRAANPLVQAPALELDDGEILTESLVICQYLDAISAPPALFGDTPLARARIGMWERRAEMLLFNRAVEYGHHVHPLFSQHITQYPDWAQTLLPRMREMLALMEAQLAAADYLCGAFSAADITAYLGYFWALAYQAVPAPAGVGFTAWAARVAARPSMATVHQLAAQFGMPVPGAA